MKDYEGSKLKFTDYYSKLKKYQQKYFVACVGMKIMCIDNLYDLHIYNGEYFTITKIEDGFITIEDDYKFYVLEPEIIFESFVMAFCVTVHKAQCISINEPYTILQWDQMDKNMKYVAVGRATKYEYLHFF